MRDLLAMHKQLGRQPVQYCQCFVYAAVTTSLGRALGLPTRPVTTFQSAHDTDRNRAIDKFYTVDEAANGEFVPAENPKNHDSVWSFHVWNEVYFKRSDVTYTMCKALGLRSGCANGWQAVDATPQEVSSGGASVAKARNQMGPASVKLVKANVNPACAETSLAIFGCFDNEFVISEVNSDINLWLSDATAKGGWRLHGRFQADPWADPYNTVGLQISTKKKGDISATCLCGSAAQSSEACPDGEESKDCSADLDDVTRYYKDAEKSGPGDPTLPACTPEDEDPDHMACSGPNLEQKPARQRGRRAAVLLDGDVGATLSFSKGLGVYPPGPVVNENGNAYSTITLGLPIQNTGSEDLGVACNFFVVAKDYRGIPFVNESETLSTAAVSGPLAIVVPAGETKSCTWSVGRDYYKEFAVTAFDLVANGGGDGEYTEAMGADEKAFMLDIRAVARGSNGQVYEGNSRKMICTPAISTRGTIVCEGGRGTAPAPTNDQAIAHLKTCSGLSSIVNDGVCHDSKNNAENCWDGGDCCTYSCSLRNGHIVELADDGKGFEYRAECQYLNDTATCFDPYFAEMPELPLTFLDRSAELVDKIYSADATDNTVCGIDGGAGMNIEDGGGGGGASGSGSGLLGLFASKVASDCDGDVAECTDACFAAVKAAVCEDDELAGFEHQCDVTSAVAARGCTMPRCSRARTNEGCRCQGSYSYYDDLYSSGQCINPDEPKEDYDWCAVVIGSCNTPTGNPTNLENNLTDDDDAGWWWDSCGSGPTSEAEGVGSILDAYVEDDLVALVVAQGYAISAKVPSRPPFPDEIIAGQDAVLVQLCCVETFELIAEDGSAGTCQRNVSAAAAATDVLDVMVDGTCTDPFRAVGRGESARCATPLPFTCPTTTVRSTMASDGDGESDGEEFGTNFDESSSGGLSPGGVVRLVVGLLILIG